MTQRKPRLLDLFCGAGGATRGYQTAGFHVTGVDSEPQPRYCGDAFIQADAFTVPVADYDVIHASPPCQAYSTMTAMWNARRDHPDLVAATRAALAASGRPYVIENVPNAPLPTAITLCGSSFGLGVEGYQLRRHRLFEVWPWLVLAPPCQHRGVVLGIYGDHARTRRRHQSGAQRGAQLPAAQGLIMAGQAMGIDWMVWSELREAIPPAYTQFVGAHLLQFLSSATAGGEVRSTGSNLCCGYPCRLHEDRHDT